MQISTKPTSQGTWGKSRKQTLVIADDFETDLALRNIRGELTVSGTLPSEASAKLSNLVLINLKAPKCREIVEKCVSEWGQPVELRYLKTMVDDLLSIVRFVPEAEIANVFSYQNWIHLGVCPISGKGRQSDDFLLGLRLARVEESVHVHEKEYIRDTASLSTGVIRAILPIARRLKPFIPPRLTALLYKVLRFVG